MLLQEGHFQSVADGVYRIDMSVWFDGIGKWSYFKIRLTDLVLGDGRIWKFDSSRVATVCIRASTRFT